MTEATLESQISMASVLLDKKDEITIRNKKIKVGWIRPDVSWRLTDLILSEDKVKERSRTQIPHKILALAVLNHPIKIALFYPLLWRIYYKIRSYSYTELLPALILVKKKHQHQTFSMAMTFCVEMMMSWKTMTTKEAKEYHQELRLGALEASEKSTDGA